MEKKEVTMHAELLEIREEGKGRNVQSQRKADVASHYKEWELLLQRPLFPRVGALRGPLYFISIICVIYCHNHLLQGLLFTMPGINKELNGTSCYSGG